MKPDWENVAPSVNAEAEFLEILNDFGDPLEIVREAISNAIDASATELAIAFCVEEIDGAKRLVITFSDNGLGMTRSALSTAFWGLGHSTARGQQKIGEKGHGTKIYLRSESVHVRTQTKDAALESVCEWPLRALTKNKLHQPQIRGIEPFREGTGTEIRIVGYNNNERSQFIQNIVRDYIYWFTKVGSIEREFGVATLTGFKCSLQCIDADKPEMIGFGHRFPAENSDIEDLFERFGADAAGKYVKRFFKKQQRLTKFPEVQYDAVVYVEGDEVKRDYNPMIRERGRSASGTYRVADRYGLWLCKDYIPVVRVNDWISGFGSGSNAYVLLHGFINCQSLKLTANRGTIANTDPSILEELQKEAQAFIQAIDQEMTAEGLYTLRGWQEEQRTVDQERIDFTRRVGTLKKRNVARHDGRLLFEPASESEVFGLLTTMYSIQPKLFDFEPLDYNTTRGIDLIVRDRREVLDEHKLGYAELKYYFSTNFNHAFRFLKWIICWDFGNNVLVDTEFTGVDGERRKLCSGFDEDGTQVYWLDAPKAPNKIHVIRLKELLERKLQLRFLPEAVFAKH